MNSESSRTKHRVRPWFARLALALFVLCMGLFVLVLFWRPVLSLGRRAFLGDRFRTRSLSVRVVRGYFPMKINNGVYMEAGSIYVSPGRSIGVVTLTESRGNYDQFRRSIQESVHATTIKKETILATSMGQIRCVEVDRSHSLIEAACLWSDAAILGTYVGPENYKYEFYDVVFSVMPNGH